MHVVLKYCLVLFCISDILTQYAIQKVYDLFITKLKKSAKKTEKGWNLKKSIWSFP